MNERQMREAMDEMHGPGAYDRMKAYNDQNEDEVRTLGGRIGFGRMMQAAEKVWGEIQPGAQHTVGPGAACLVPCPCRADGVSNNCDWCCGVGKVTERVERAMKLDAALTFLDEEKKPNRRADLVLSIRIAPTMSTEECVRLTSRTHGGPR